MLPFLKKQQESQTGVIVKTRAPDEPGESEDKDDPSAAHHAAAHEMLQSIKSGDHKRLSEAFKDMLEIHNAPEASGDKDNSFEAQNQKATKEQE